MTGLAARLRPIVPRGDEPRGGLKRLLTGGGGGYFRVPRGDEPRGGLKPHHIITFKFHRSPFPGVMNPGAD